MGRRENLLTGGKSYIRDERLFCDGARRPNPQRPVNNNPPVPSDPCPVVIIEDGSPIDLCDDDPPPGVNPSAVLVEKKDVTSDNEYDTDVRHRMFNLLKSRDVEGSNVNYSQGYIRTNMVDPLIQRRIRICIAAWGVVRVLKKHDQISPVSYTHLTLPTISSV